MLAALEPMSAERGPISTAHDAMHPHCASGFVSPALARAASQCATIFSRVSRTAKAAIPTPAVAGSDAADLDERRAQAVAVGNDLGQVVLRFAWSLTVLCSGGRSCS